METLELNLNALWIIGVIFIAIFLIITILFAIRSNPSHIANVQLMLPNSDCQKYKKQSSEVHPDNTSLCEDMQVKEVIELGIEKMMEEKFDLLKGVDIDGLSS